MTEIQKILTANLIEELRQIQTYLVLAFSASLSALALALIPVKSTEDEDTVAVPLFSVPLPRAFAQLVLWLLTLIGGFMAGSSASSAYFIARKLRSVPGLLEAVGTFPSAATSPLSAVRFCLGYLPPVLSAAAVFWLLRRDKSPGITYAVTFVLLLAAYVPLWLVLPELARLLGTP